MLIEANVGGVEFALRASGSLKLGGFYELYPSLGGPPNLRLEAVVSDDFADGRVVGPSHPGFETRTNAGCIALSRYDAEGLIRLDSDGVVTGDFRCSSAANSLEAIIRIGLSITLPRHGALILHSSAVADTRGVHVFSGLSGAGKSTISTMLAETNSVLKLADELLILRRQAGGDWWAQVSPFIGSDGLPHGEERPLSSINFLQQHPRHQRTSLAPAQAMRELCQHILTYGTDMHTRQHVLDLVGDLVQTTACYQLQFAKDPTVREVLGLTC